jgi:hypothetical protein
MSAIDDELYKYLIAIQAIAALISARIYPDFAPQNEAYPLVVYSLSEDRSVATLSGPSKLRERTYRFDIWGVTIAEVTAIGIQLRAALDGYNGTMGTLTYVASSFEGEDRTRDSETMAFRLTQQYRIWYHEV